MIRLNLYTVKQVKEKGGLYNLNSKRIGTPADANVIIDTVLDLSSEAVEKFGILTLNTKNEVAGIHILSIGHLSATIVHPREVFKAAILNNAASLICFHNHPSGDPTPSPEDINVTRRLKGKIDIERLKGRPCYGGLDLSSKIDITAFVLLFPPDDINQKWIVLPYFWVPEDRVRERVETDRVPYDLWVKQGFLKTTPGNVIDYAFIEKEIKELANTFDIQEIGFDPWNAMQTAVNLGNEGLIMVEIRQGFRSMSPAMKEIEQLVRGKKLLHNGHPVLRWNVGNVEVKTDENENIRPVKGKGIERIDGLVAMINAMARAMLQDQKPDASRYASGEFLDSLWG